MDQAIAAVFDSWNSERAVLYRRQERIPTDLGTAVNICSMVFGNLGMDSGTGVAFTRDPSTGQPRACTATTCRTPRARTSSPGSATRCRSPTWSRSTRRRTTTLMSIMATLEGHYRDLCDIEFTVERGKLWMLQTRVGKRTAAAAFRIATSLVDEGLIDTDEALRRVSGAQLAQLMFPRFDTDADTTSSPRRSARHRAPPPARSSSPRRQRSRPSGRGEQVILVRRETNPDDLHGMIAAQGILTSRGGKTSHAAVVARGWVRPASAARTSSRSR